MIDNPIQPDLKPRLCMAQPENLNGLPARAPKFSLPDFGEYAISQRDRRRDENNSIQSTMDGVHSHRLLAVENSGLFPAFLFVARL